MSRPILSHPRPFPHVSPTRWGIAARIAAPWRGIRARCGCGSCATFRAWVTAHLTEVRMSGRAGEAARDVTWLSPKEF